MLTAAVLNEANDTLAEAGGARAPLKRPRLHPRNTRMCYFAWQKRLEVGTPELKASRRGGYPGSGSRSSLVPRVPSVETTPQRGRTEDTAEGQGLGGHWRLWMAEGREGGNGVETAVP